MIRTIALAACVGILGCADEADELEGDVTPGTLVNVALAEYEVTPFPTSASAGAITFSVSNQGTETHQFLVVRTDLAAEDLPTKSDGSFDENGGGGEVKGKLNAVPAGATFELPVSLEAGSYVLLCNLVATEGDETESHFHEGMHAPFTVQ